MEEQRCRAAIRPLQIVDQQQQRPALGDRVQHLGYLGEEIGLQIRALTG